MRGAFAPLNFFFHLNEHTHLQQCRTHQVKRDASYPGCSPASVMPPLAAGGRGFEALQG
jgi:hypothetical protein